MVLLCCLCKCNIGYCDAFSLHVLYILYAGDHFYKENTGLPLEEQMITAMPDVQSRDLEAGDEFIVLACDGIWYESSIVLRCAQCTCILAITSYGSLVTL